MKVSKNYGRIIAVFSALAIVTVAVSQIKALIKLVGVGAAVHQFGPQINSTINHLDGHRDSPEMFTKVVPIVSAGISSRQAVGAAQVMGVKSQVSKVQAVAELNQDVFGREIKIQALIPISTTKNLKNISAVPGVGVSGIVDLKL